MPTHISLRLRHPSQDLSMAASRLGFPIARIWASGESRKTIAGGPMGGEYRESYCAMSIVSEPATIAEAIQTINRTLVAAVDSLPILDDATLRKSLYCTLETEGEVIDSAALKLLAYWNIELEISGN